MSRPLMKAIGLSRVRIEKIAQSVIKDFDPNALTELIEIDIERLYEQYIPKRFGISTGYQELSVGIHGFTNPTKLESAVSVTLVDAADASTRRFGRSTIGHEAGHCILHAHQFRKRQVNDAFLHDGTHDVNQKLFRQEDIRAFESPEWQAWEFCKSLFLPRQVLEEAMEKGYTIRKMSDMTNLNPAFVETRLRNLRMLDKVRAF